MGSPFNNRLTPSKMSLPDTAEYWWDVKRKHNKHVFVHLKGYDCGHYHVYETKKLHEVDCHACKRHIDSDKDLSQKLAQHHK